MNKKLRFCIITSLFLLLQTHLLFARQIEIASHRGANRHAPENTMHAAMKAIELGSSYLEVDVRRSKDGVYFNFHDFTLDRTTNGTGNFEDFTSSELRQFDAGSWFRHSFRGEKIPTIEDLVLSFRNKIRFYFDFKSGDIEEFIGLVKEWGVADNCFFNSRGDYNTEDLEVLKKAGIAFKINISSIKEFNEIYDKWEPQIVEVRVHNLTHELVKAVHAKGAKVMAYIPGDQYELYLQCLKYSIDMVNLDNPDVFLYVLKNNELPPPLWIAHRGTIVNDNFIENQPEGIIEVFKRAYTGVEIDIQETQDGHLVVHHDRNMTKFFNADAIINQISLKEVKSYTSLQGNFKVLTLDEYLALVPGDAILMFDLKSPTRSETFYQKLRESITRRHNLNQTIFIDRDARDHFWGEARFSARVSELPEIFKKWSNGENVACHYFLFDHGNVLSAQWVRLAQRMSMEVIPSVNTFHYRGENYLFSGIRDIDYLRKLGVTLYQIDSVYEEYMSKLNTE